MLRTLLSDRGSIYLHIDYKIGHYVKVLMDEVFGADNFRNDITRIKCNPKNFARRAYGNVKDMILFYSKSSNPIRNDPRDPFVGRLSLCRYLAEHALGLDLNAVHGVGPRRARSRCR